MSQDKEIKVYGKYQNIRKNLDYEYHENYSEGRQLLQDRLIDDYINGFSLSTREPPLLLYTAGPMGAGKTHSVKILAPQLGIDLSQTILIDPDKFKNLIPEFEALKMADPENAGSIVHKESGLMAEIALEIALQRNLNIINDGSMVNYEWFIKEFKRIRKIYPQYQKIEIMYVHADWNTVFQRATKRGEITGRKIKKDQLFWVWQNVPKSIDILKDHVDHIYYVEN